MNRQRFDLDKMLPHQGNMRWLDRIIDVNDKMAHGEAIIRNDHVLFDPEIKGVYAHVGVEWMAQTAAIFGSHYDNTGTPKIGMLMSVRQYVARRPFFAVGDCLDIFAYNEYLEENVGHFICEIQIQGETVAEGKLNAFLPNAAQLQTILRGE